MQEDVAWTTRQRAADTVEAFGKRVSGDLMQHARMLMDAADTVTADPSLLDRRHIRGSHNANPAKLIALWLAIRETQADIEDMTGHLLSKSTKYAGAMAALAALEIFRSASAQDGAYAGSARIPDEVDQVMRDLIGKATNTRRVGDEVCWREGAAKITGRILAIADGICAIGRMTRWEGASGVGVRGIATKAVGDLELMMPDLY